MSMMLKFSKNLSFLFVSVILFVLILVMLLLSTRYYADYQTTLLPGIYIQDGSSDLKANNWSVPFVYDWNSNGKRDLLVGSRYIEKNNISYGYVSFYDNTGTDTEPSFNGSIKVEACTNKCVALNVTADG